MENLTKQDSIIFQEKNIVHSVQEKYNKAISFIASEVH